MKRMLAAVAILAVCAGSMAACRRLMPTNSFLRPRAVPHVSKSTAEARAAFNHGRHEKILAGAHVECIDCHRFDYVIDTGDPEIAAALSAHGLYPGSVTCHFCHVGDSPGKMTAAPSACTTCHVNLAPLRPESHEIAWMKVHGADARANPVECESCHRQSFCIDCHQRRDSVQTIGHERNFRFLHSIEARANPMQCSACHREDFCTSCHTRGDARP